MTLVTADSSRQFVMLAPAGARIPGPFRSTGFDAQRHTELLADMQRFRGRVYLRDGAIERSQLNPAGRHEMGGDNESWHLLRLRKDGSVSGCARILVHSSAASFPSLRLAGSAIANCANWARDLREAVEAEMVKARRSALTLIEPGGWALAEDLRGSMEALSIALSAFAWSQIFGGCLGFLTATVRHESCCILRRLGGVSLQSGDKTIPRYFDPAFGCDMELLRFDTHSLNPRFEPVLARMRAALLAAPVISAGSRSHEMARAAAA